jgi:hypothetical protein
MSEVGIRKVVANEADLNRDSLSGETGAHPIGTGAGSASGGVAGAMVGLGIGGPVGGLIGAAVGAVAGGLMGSSTAELVNPTAEETFWRETFVREPYYVEGTAYEYYAPGFRAGWEGRVRHDGRTFEEAEAELKVAYSITRTELQPEWQAVRPAARAAWDRVSHIRSAKQ